MENIKKIFLKITRPCLLSVLISALLIVFMAIATPLVLIRGDVLGIVEYSLFVISAVGLTYVVCVIVRWAPTFKKDIVTYLEGREITRRLIQNWGYRTVVTSTVSFGMTLLSSVTNAYLGITERSIWFGALAAYYIFLALMRSGLLLYHKNKRDFDSEALIRAKKYTQCGVWLLILNATLSSAIAQMIFDDRYYEYKDWLIYAFAAYAFYKIIMSVRNAIKARRQDDLTIQAIREINLVDAAVSILALQTALLHTFSDQSVDISLFNTLTGSVVSLFSISLSIYMIVKGYKTIKEIKNGRK